MDQNDFLNFLQWIKVEIIHSIIMRKIRLISNLAKNCADPEYSKMFIEGAQETHVTSCDSLPNPSSYRLAGNRWLQNHQQLNNQG